MFYKIIMKISAVSVSPVYNAPAYPLYIVNY